MLGGMAERRLPEEWPAGVHPYWAEDFPQSAAEWLLGLLPADYRIHGVLRRYPAALSALAVRYVRAELAAAREGYRAAPDDLVGPPAPGRGGAGQGGLPRGGQPPCAHAPRSRSR